jgi:hypothetical protein
VFISFLYLLDIGDIDGTLVIKKDPIISHPEPETKPMVCEGLNISTGGKSASSSTAL